jgi:hypothetical protein
MTVRHPERNRCSWRMRLARMTAGACPPPTLTPPRQGAPAGLRPKHSYNAIAIRPSTPLPRAVLAVRAAIPHSCLAPAN